jgi:hypothetical protein
MAGNELFQIQLTLATLRTSIAELSSYIDGAKILCHTDAQARLLKDLRILSEEMADQCYDCEKAYVSLAFSFIPTVLKQKIPGYLSREKICVEEFKISEKLPVTPVKDAQVSLEKSKAESDVKSEG